MHILITGGSGFIGSHLVEHHLAKGDLVHVVDDMSTGTVQNLAAHKDDPNLHVDEANIVTWPALEKAVAWADRVYHMAAVVGMKAVLAEPTRVLSTNVAGCERVLRAAHASSWRPMIVLASSSEVYGSGVHNGFDEDGDLVIRSGARSRWNYAISKLADEALGLSYARKFEMPVTVVRLFNITGRRQTGRYGMVVPRFVEQAVAGKAMTVYGDGAQTRCFCDARDMVAALDLICSHTSATGEIFNVGNDEEISINALAELVRQRAGSDSSIERIPYSEAYGEDFDDVLHRKPVLKKLRALGFKHRYSLADTLDDLIAHWRVSRAAAAG
jgi:UDP-glucose 4-epimerase